MLFKKIIYPIKSLYYKYLLISNGLYTLMDNSGYAVYTSALHKYMLLDRVRMEKFDKAIKNTVKQGDVVIDLGSGTGILGFLAIKYGAKKVYAIEKDKQIIIVAKQLAKLNGYGNKIEFIHGNSFGLKKETIPEQVDLIVTETIGSMGITKNIVKYVADARHKWLRDDGKIIPKRLSLFVAPVFYKKYKKMQLQFKKNKIVGLNFSFLSKVSDKQGTHFISRKIIKDNEPISLETFDLNEAIDIKFGSMKKIIFIPKKDYTMNGLCGWFTAELSDGIILDTSPFSLPTHWGQVFFPFEERKCKKGIPFSVYYSYKKKDKQFISIDFSDV